MLRPQQECCLGVGGAQFVLRFFGQQSHAQGSLLLTVARRELAQTRVVLAQRPRSQRLDELVELIDAQK